MGQDFRRVLKLLQPPELRIGCQGRRTRVAAARKVHNNIQCRIIFIILVFGEAKASLPDIPHHRVWPLPPGSVFQDAGIIPNY